MGKTRIIRQIIRQAATEARGPVVMDVAADVRPGSDAMATRAATSNDGGRTRKSFVIGFDQFSDGDAYFD